MKKVQHGKSATLNEWSTKKGATRKKCKMKKVQHGKIAT